MEGTLKLTNGSRIAVIGGGPAGSFFSHFALKFIRNQGISATVTIFDAKSFLTHLPKDCNMCAGVLGFNLIKKLKAEGISIEGKSIRQEIAGYAFHLKNKFITLYKAPHSPIYTVFRGMGPVSDSDEHMSFDRFLLDKVVAEGAQWKKEHVREIISSGKEKPRILTDENPDGEEYDFVAGAFGVNTRLSREMSFGYVPPKTWHACQAEILVDEEFVNERIGNMIHVFNFGEKTIKLIAITPKKNILTITAIGEHVKIKDLKEALSYGELKNYIPAGREIVCHCHPKLPVTAAKNPFSDRMAIIGDACDSRYLKNGIESSFFTAYFAADTVVNHGIDKENLKLHYFKRCRKLFGIDNLCGKMMFAVNNYMAKNRFFIAAQIAIADAEQQSAPSKRYLSKSMWHFFSGEAPYLWILRKSLKPRLVISFIKQAGRAFFLNLFQNRNVTDKARNLRKKISRKIVAVPTYTCEEGTRVVIIGGGPAGSSCAIRLLKLAKESGKDIKVTIFEGKDYSVDYNQCMGILSPDAIRVFFSLVGQRASAPLFRNRIERYTLCTESEKVDLIRREDNKPFYTVRRSEMDSFLLDYAKSLGAEVIRSRVNGIEFPQTSFTDEVRVYSESCFVKADVVVGAFGLDDSMMECFEKATGKGKAYRRPKKFMKTFITKIQADTKFIEEKFENGIFAFLLSTLPRIEFAAMAPKDDQIIVNIAGRNITSLDMDAFLNHHVLRKILPPVDISNLKYYAGRFPISHSTGSFGNRYVIVGDATGWVKPFKSHGIDMALITGVRAAEVLFKYGFSEESFSYYADLCRDLTSDFYYGAMIRYLSGLGTDFNAMDLFVRHSRDNHYFYDVLYNCISGDKSYREIASSLLRLRLLKPLLSAIMKSMPGGRSGRN
ncbi:MAG: hypothetical protein HZA77_15315 [Candidatus Schekmanbacteria bacterium]|nr:hypothetical protein [Candidatus Schekmanbacteria bacterium]